MDANLHFDKNLCRAELVAWAKETSNVGFRELMVGKEGDFKHSILLSPLKLQIYVTRNGVDWMKSNYVETCNPSS